MGFISNSSEDKGDSYDYKSFDKVKLGPANSKDGKMEITENIIEEARDKLKQISPFKQGDVFTFSMTDQADWTISFEVVDTYPRDFMSIDKDTTIETTENLNIESL